jgi:ABC-type multidrug transport system permease subunit
LALQGRFGDPEWWTGEPTGWTTQSQLKLPVHSSFSDGGTEFTVHFLKRFQRYLEFQATGFGSAVIAELALGGFAPGCVLAFRRRASKKAHLNRLKLSRIDTLLPLNITFQFCLWSA